MDTSLGERLLATRDKHQKATEETRPVPGYEGQLTATYRGLTFREGRAIGKRHEAILDEAEQEIRIAADVLAKSCTGCQAHIDGETKDLPALGLGLAQSLGVDGPENDAQAVLMIFPSERAVVEEGAAVEKLGVTSGQKADGHIAGNSEAAS